MYGKLVSGKWSKWIDEGKFVFSINGVGILDINMRKGGLYHFPDTIHKICFKMGYGPQHEDFKSGKILEKKIWENICNLG